MRDDKNPPSTHIIQDPATPLLVRVAIGIVIAINVILGPTMAYPIIVKKGLESVGLIKKKKQKKKKGSSKDE